jgi:hypothetical protein
MLSALAWLLAATDPVGAAPPGQGVSAAVGVVRAYYAAVSRHDYRAAFALWHGRQSYARFRRGYAQTVRATVTPIAPFDSEGAAGSVYATVKVRVDALLRSGRYQHFVGSYTLRRVNDVPGSTAAQRRWHIVGAYLAPVPAGR